VTALAGRRRRSTIVASIAAVVAAALVVTLTTIGALSLYNSTDGANASARSAELVFPKTPVGALAALDGDGKLASLAVLVVPPAGKGGSIIPVPVSADSSGGEGPDRLPLDETLAVQGQQALRDELSVALRLGVDDVAYVDAAQLTRMLAPVGPLSVDLPIAVTGADGRVVADAGESTMDAAAAAAVLTARDSTIPAAQEYKAAAAVWAAVAKAAGGGGAPPTASAAAGSTTTSTTAAPSADAGAASSAAVKAMFTDLLAGRIGERALRTAPVPAAQNPRGVDVTVLDPAEVLLVFGQIAPGAVSAPGSGLSFRVISSFSPDQLAGTGLSNTEVAYRAIARILAGGGNVVSVSTSGAEAGSATQLAVSDASMVSGVEQDGDEFGLVKVIVDPQPIAGVDVIATLGTAALEPLAAATATTTTTTGSSGPSTSPSSSPPAGTATRTTERRGG
jgi:hypothetical protein